MSLSCCARPDQKGWKVLISGSNLKEITGQLRKQAPVVAQHSMKSVYGWGDSTPSFRQYKDLLIHNLTMGSQFSLAKIPSVLELHASDMATILKTSHKGLFVVGFTPLEKIVGLQKESAQAALSEFATLFEGSPKKCAKSLQWVTPAIVDKVIRQLELTTGDIESASKVRRGLYNNLNLHQNPKGVYVKPKFNNAIAVDTTNSKQAVSKIMQLVGSNMQGEPTMDISLTESPEDRLRACHEDSCTTIASLVDTLTQEIAAQEEILTAATILRKTTETELANAETQILVANEEIKNHTAAHDRLIAERDAAIAEAQRLKDLYMETLDKYNETVARGDAAQCPTLGTEEYNFVGAQLVAP